VGSRGEPVGSSGPLAALPGSNPVSFEEGPKPGFFVRLRVSDRSTNDTRVGSSATVGMLDGRVAQGMSPQYTTGPGSHSHGGARSGQGDGRKEARTVGNTSPLPLALHWCDTCRGVDRNTSFIQIVTVQKSRVPSPAPILHGEYMTTH
jgi:hypothetical protein